MTPGAPKDPEDKGPDRVDLLVHDIRAALSDVIGGLRLIEPNDLPEAAQQYLEKIELVDGHVIAPRNDGAWEVGPTKTPEKR